MSSKGSVEEEDDIEENDVDNEGISTRCRWIDCNLEFSDMAQLVSHINSSHIIARRGSEEYPCFWKVIS